MCSLKAVHVPTREEIREERKRRYLEAWPIEAQLEAMAEMYAGRFEKREKMLADFDRIRESLPFLCDEEGL